MPNQQTDPDDAAEPAGSDAEAPRSPTDPVADFAARQVPVATLGAALAVCAALAFGIGRITRPAAIDAVADDAGSWASLIAMAMTLICLIQVAGWRLTSRRSAPERDDDVVGGRLPFWAHVVSYPVLVAGLFAAATVLVAEQTVAPAIVLTLVGVVALILAQAIGAANFVRPGGDGGTIPAHLRRLRAFDRSRREPPGPEDDGSV